MDKGHLNLGCSIGETVLIGDDIEIQFYKFDRKWNQVKIRITCDKNIKILRKELLKDEERK